MLERQALKRADRVVCVSEKPGKTDCSHSRKQTRAHRGEERDAAPYSRTAESSNHVPQRSRHPDVGFCFWFCRPAQRRKRSPLHGLRVSQTLCGGARRSQLYLIIVGDGKEEQPIKQQATRLGIREQVHFAGFQGSPTEWMQMMDCLVQPSLTEGTPNTVLEALCLKLPVIASAVGGVPDLIVDGKNGLLVSAADVDQLADAMKKCGAPRTCAAS